MGGTREGAGPRPAFWPWPNTASGVGSTGKLLQQVRARTTQEAQAAHGARPAGKPPAEGVTPAVGNVASGCRPDGPGTRSPPLRRWQWFRPGAQPRAATPQTPARGSQVGSAGVSSLA